VGIPRKVSRRPIAASIVCGLLLAAAALAVADEPLLAQTQTTAAPQGPPPELSPSQAKSNSISSWFNPSTAPFLPIPLIDTDPYSGTTVGLIPTVLVTNDQGEIRRIIAPDVLYNEYFGYGGHGRVFAYPSANTQWSIEGGAKQHVESEFDGEYAAGLLRQDAWSINVSVIYDRSGSGRFFGIGNDSCLCHESNYTDQQKYVQLAIGRNLSHTWQIGYVFRPWQVEITPGHIPGIPSIDHTYPNAYESGDRNQFLNRLYLTYDTRDDLTVPTRGTQWVIYGGIASATGVANANLYTETGIDARHFWKIQRDAVLAGHIALRYMPHTSDLRLLPFWALSSIGGDRAIVGGDQPLRGFGAARFRDRDSFSASLEYRKRVWSLNAFATRIELELAPFVDTGRVFAASRTDPLSHLHWVGGVGVRGIASPFVVGYVDVGYGSEGAAVFTGLAYPF